MIEKQLDDGESAQLEAYAILTPARHRELRERCFLWGSVRAEPRHFVGLEPQFAR